MAPLLYDLPDEVILTTLSQRYPCREQPLRSLLTLLHPRAALCRNVVVYGAEATGKSSLTNAVLHEIVGESSSDASPYAYAIVDSKEYITARHLFESIVGRVATALGADDAARRCETVSQLAVRLSQLLGSNESAASHFVLVLDSIDRQREASATLLPALARLSEIIPNLTTVFIVTSPSPSFLRMAPMPHVYFPDYSKSDFVQIQVTRSPPTLPTATAEDTADLWSRFCGAVHDSLIKSARHTLPAFEEACAALWPRFTAPILAGTHGPREFSKLLIASRVHFQDETILEAGLVTLSVKGSKPQGSTTTARSKLSHQPGTTTDLSSLLPTTARLLLLAAYLASHNATKHDLTLFSTYYHGRKRRRGGLLGNSGPRSKHRKIARKLLGAHAFVLERMLAIYAVVKNEWVSNSKVGGKGMIDGDVGMALATLASLRLLVKIGGGGDPVDRGGKWKVNVGWEVVRALGRSMGVEVADWLID